jgi:antitoxin (DNA-binding transcriptional repressor) of toxin-antitoxin stability system
MTKVTIHAAKTNLSKLIKQVEAGEDVIICRGDQTVAKLTAPDEPPVRRRPGILKENITVSDEFYDPWSPKDFGPGVMDDLPEWGSSADVWDGRTPRKPGLLKGVVALDESFFDPLTDEELGLADDPRDGR